MKKEFLDKIPVTVWLSGKHRILIISLPTQILDLVFKCFLAIAETLVISNGKTPPFIAQPEALIKTGIRGMIL